MANDKKSSIIKEALTDYNAIREAAEANAKNKLAEEFSGKYSELLKEEINKNKSAKESYKKLDEAKESDKTDETEPKKESDMKKDVKETVKVVDTVGKGKPFETKPKGVAKVEEDVHITDTVGKPDPFTEKKGKKVEEDVKVTDTIGKPDPFTEKKKGAVKIEEEREKSFSADVEGQTPNLGKDKSDKLKGPSSGKPITNIKEEFDISELDMSSVGTALEGADDEDEVITIDEIEAEINQMEGLGEELNDMGGLPRPELQQRGTPEGQGGDAFSQLVNMRKQLDEMIKNMGGEAAPVEEMALQSDEMSPEEFQSTNAPLEEDEAITDADIDAVLGTAPEGQQEQPVEEAMGISYSDGTITPGKLGDHDGTHGRFRHQGVDESKKVNRLIEENKKLTKKLNETVKFKKSATTLVESYKSALEKYRNQLKEMAIFNTNLAHVNNLLVNESLALTQDDKIKIINEFKKVDSIAESQKKYKGFLTEMKGSKKTITESIETKVSASIQPSSKQKLDEVVEKTAYANDAHIQRMRKLIETIENRGKKIIK